MQIYKIPLRLILIIAFFLHVLMIAIILLPRPQQFFRQGDPFARDQKSSNKARQLIVNINQDNKPDKNNSTLLSDKDSSGRGHITPLNKDSWLSDFLRFRTKRGTRGRDKSGKQGNRKGEKDIIAAKESDITIMLLDKSRSARGFGGVYEQVTIPNRHSFTRENAIYFTKDGNFSFNSTKFKHFKYMHNMVYKIRSNWYPPMMANVVFGSRTAPGRTRIMAIPPQDVKTYFILNRQGTIVRSGIIESLGNRPLNEACMDAIRKSKNFGPVPGELIKDRAFLVIPFLIRFR